jgi:cardiolipin synthase
VDGWLARVRNARSRLGAILDPVADKTLLVSMYVTLAAVGVLPDWLAILVVFRDLLIVGGVIVLHVLGQPPAIQPIMLSKANTVLQIALAAGALFFAGFTIPTGPLLGILVAATAATTVASGAAYVWLAARRTR